MDLRHKIRYTVLGFLATLFLLAGLYLLAMQIAVSARESSEWLEHTNEVKHAIDEFKTVFEQADLAQREKMAYGGTSGVAGDVRPKVWMMFDKVAQLTEDNPAQQARLETMRRNIGKRFESYDQLIRISEQQGADAAIMVSLKSRTLDDLREIENEFGDLRNEEWKLYYTRAETAKGFRQTIGSIAIVVYVLTVVVLLGSFYTTLKTLSLQKRTADSYRLALGKARKKANEEIQLDAKLAEDILGILDGTRHAEQGVTGVYVV